MLDDGKNGGFGCLGIDCLSNVYDRNISEYASVCVCSVYISFMVFQFRKQERIHRLLCVAKVDFGGSTFASSSRRHCEAATCARWPRQSNMATEHIPYRWLIR